MIITVTPNTGIDQTIIIQSFIPNRTIRAFETHFGMGGKGTGSAWIMGKWGVPNLAMGFAAGVVGEQMEKMLQKRGVETDFTWVGGSSRLNPHIICLDGSGQSTITSNSLVVTNEHIEAFYQKIDEFLPKASCLLLSGSLPKNVPMDFLPKLINKAKLQNVPTLLDSSGLYLRAGVEASPYLIKPNRFELEDLCGENAPTREDVLRLAGQLRSLYDINLIVTLGWEGAFALIDEQHYWIPAIPVQPITTAGAGDAVMAGMAITVSQKLPIEEGLRLSFALATATLLTPATCDYRLEDVHKFISQVKVIRI
jgi:1-phosphofructokinase family hexose kinase